MVLFFLKLLSHWQKAHLRLSANQHWIYIFIKMFAIQIITTALSSILLYKHSRFVQSELLSFDRCFYINLFYRTSTVKSVEFSGHWKTQLYVYASITHTLYYPISNIPSSQQSSYQLPLKIKIKIGHIVTGLSCFPVFNHWGFKWH